jgi:NAD(P)H-dependent FMN reductase
MVRITIIIGSTRPGGKAKAVADWVYEIAWQREDADFGLLDIADFDLPLLDEPAPAFLLDARQPVAGQYTQERTRAWSEAVASFDGYAFVTPEYNHGTSGALKNAIEFPYHEWRDRAAGFVGYGYTMGARAIESLRLTLAAMQVATVRPAVGISLLTNLDKGTTFKPLHTEICLTFAAVQALKDGYEVMFVADAVGGRSQAAQHTGIESLSHAGAVPTTALAVATELFRDWATPLAGPARDVIYRYFTEVPKLTDEVGVAEAEKLAAAAHGVG